MFNPESYDLHQLLAIMQCLGHVTRALDQFETNGYIDVGPYNKWMNDLYLDVFKVFKTKADYEMGRW